MKNRLFSFFDKIKDFSKANKILAGVLAVAIVFGSYAIYKHFWGASTGASYTLAAVKRGDIVTTVSGSGQVSADNQIDVSSQVSGTITSINVAVGQTVKKGSLLATIDSHDAYISLQNAKLALAKLTKAAKSGDVTTSENSINKAYDDGFNAVSNAFLDLPDIMTGMNNLFYVKGGFLSDQYSSSLNTTGLQYRNSAGVGFDAANREFQVVMQKYHGLSRSSATSDIDELIQETYAALKDVSKALQDTQKAVDYISTTQTDYYPSLSSAASTNVVSWLGKVNTDISSVSGAQNSIQSSQNSLNNLVNSADPLDIQTSELSVSQAEDTYAKYFIRAPFDGVVGRIPVSVYGQAGSNTVIATVVGNKKMANISLNEVDAAKVKFGQDVNITFDAIDGLNATGTVSQVDLVGSVSSGVVSYGVKIAVNTADDRIKPGMSVNTSIITSQKTGVLLVPSSAIKTKGNVKYVEVLDSATSTGQGGGRFGGNQNRQYGNATSSDMNNASSSSSFGSAFNANASSTSGSSTQRRSGLGNRTITISSTLAPRQVVVTVGDSDDTNTEILSGLSAGDLVITKTTTSSSATQTSTAPSILSGLSGGRVGGARTGVGGAGRPAGN